MSILLMKLRGVPDEELQEVRTLLEEADIDFYETSGGNWGMSLPGLWLRDESRLQEARSILDEYQASRLQQAREQYEEDKKQGRTRGWTAIFLDNPWRFLLYMALVGLLVYISTIPWFGLGSSSS